MVNAEADRPEILSGVLTFHPDGSGALNGGSVAVPAAVLGRVCPPGDRQRDAALSVWARAQRAGSGWEVTRLLGREARGRVELLADPTPHGLQVRVRRTPAGRGA